MPQYIQQCSDVWDTSFTPPVCTATTTNVDVSLLTGGMDSSDFQYLEIWIITTFALAFGVRMIIRVINP